MAMSNNEPDYKDNLAFENKEEIAGQPTINTFEELSNVLDVEICKVYARKPFEEYIAIYINSSEMSYHKDGEIVFGDYFFSDIAPQQAYNIIKCLQDNLGE